MFLKCCINSSFDLAYSPLMARIVSLNFALSRKYVGVVSQNGSLVIYAGICITALRTAISIFSISLNINSRSFLSKRYNIMTFLNVASFLKTCAVLGVLAKGTYRQTNDSSRYYPNNPRLSACLLYTSLVNEAK